MRGLALAGPIAPGEGSVAGRGEVEKPRQLKLGQDLPLAVGQGGALGGLSFGGGQGDQVHPVQLLPDSVPGLVGGVLRE